MPKARRRSGSGAGPAPRPARRGARRRYLIAMTGASGSIYGVDFVRRCPGEKYLVLSDWARQVLHAETGLKPSALEPHVKRVFADSDLAAPFSSGSNRYDALIVIPCSVSTLAKIAAGIADTLVTRAAQVALKERMRMVLCVRETPLSSIALENSLKLSREGVVIMPISPPWYAGPRSLDDLVAGFSGKVLTLLGEPGPSGWRGEDLE
jgi:4-hydroxy-3-polyprenylbenzoate decarboxylase